MIWTNRENTHKHWQDGRDQIKQGVGRNQKTTAFLIDRGVFFGLPSRRAQRTEQELGNPDEDIRGISFLLLLLLLLLLFFMFLHVSVLLDTMVVVCMIQLIGVARSTQTYNLGLFSEPPRELVNEFSH